MLLSTLHSTRLEGLISQEPKLTADKCIVMGQQILIVGPLKLQNELLMGSLGQEIGLACVCLDSCEIVSVDTRQNSSKSLVLWDCLGIDNDTFWLEIDEFKTKNDIHCTVALFNLPHETGFEKDAVQRGVRGVFYKNDSMSLLCKGIRAILNGELWFSRDVMTQCVIDYQNNHSFTGPEALPTITPREKEILVMIASGYSNSKIADDLCISPHTVRTHIYNLYSKINVPNRVQAALWAAKYFTA